MEKVKRKYTKRKNAVSNKEVLSIKDEVMNTQWISIIPRRHRSDSDRPITVKTYVTPKKVINIVYTFSDGLCEKLGWAGNERLTFSYDKHNTKKFMIAKNETGYKLSKAPKSKSASCSFVPTFEIKAPATFLATHKIYRNQLIVTLED